jgi:N-acetylglucosamine-6-phosphate deacetylase
MASAVRKTVEVTGLPVTDVSAMASATPAAFLSLQHSIGAIAPGQRADWAWLDAALQPRATWIGGRMVSQAASDLVHAAI